MLRFYCSISARGLNSGITTFNLINLLLGFIICQYFPLFRIFLAAFAVVPSGVCVCVCVVGRASSAVAAAAAARERIIEDREAENLTAFLPLMLFTDRKQIRGYVHSFSLVCAG